MHISALTTIQPSPCPAFMPWVTHTTSITDKLQAITGTVRLQRIGQRWVSTNWWDKYFLKVQENSVLQREIVMLAGDVPYWYARTVIPKSCYAVEPAFFDRLTHVTMRELIFGEAKVQRESLQYYQIDSQNIEFYWAKDILALSAAEKLWVRLGTYSFQGRASFYLIEILLPSLKGLL